MGNDIYSRHKLHLRNYTSQFNNAESMALIASCVIVLHFSWCLSLSGRDNKRLAVSICTRQTSQNQTLTFL